MTIHHLDDSVTQPFWDNSVEPRLVIESGDTVVFECLEASGQLSKESTVNDYLTTERKAAEMDHMPVVGIAISRPVLAHG